MHHIIARTHTFHKNNHTRTPHLHVLTAISQLGALTVEVCLMCGATTQEARPQRPYARTAMDNRPRPSHTIAVE